MTPLSDSVGSVSVDVVPDARGWSEKLRAQLRDQKVEIKADADTTEANAELDRAARTRTAKIKADTSQLSEGASKLDSFVKNLGLLPALAIAGSAALIPLAGALGGIAAALAAPLVIAGGGATLFGLLAGFAVKDTEKQLKVIEAAQKKLDGLTKGTKEYAAQAKVLRDAQKSLSPAQRGFVDAQSNLAASFQNFIGGKAGVALLRPLTQGMGLLADILPHLTPILVAASGAFSDLLGGIGRAVDSPGFDKFIHTVSGQVGHDIEGFARAAGNIATGLGGLFVTLDKSAGHSMVDELVKLTGAFSDWANSRAGRRDVREFLDYFHRVGPQVADTIGSVARGVGHLVQALAPLGPPILRVIQGIADAISGIPVPVLTALAASFVGLTAFQKVGGLKTISNLAALGNGKIGGGILGSLAGKAGVVPVFVTNKGFGVDGGIPGVPGGGTGSEPKTRVGRVLANGEKVTPFQALLVGAAAYEGYQGVRRGVGNINTAGSSMFASTGSVGGSGPRTSRTAPAAIYPGLNYADASVGLHNITQGTSALASLKAAAGGASRAVDMIGPHAAQASSVANRALSSVQAHLDSLHDKKIQIIAQTAQAISSLERLQAWRIANKTFTITAQYQQRERAVGPGGGIGHHARGGMISGAGTGTSDSIPSWLSNGEYVVNAAAAAQNRALLDQINSGRSGGYAPAPAATGGASFPSHMTLMLDDGTALRAYVASVADSVHGANAAYQAVRAGL